MTNTVLILEIYYKISKKKPSRMQIYNLRRVYDCTTPGFSKKKIRFIDAIYRFFKGIIQYRQRQGY